MNRVKDLDLQERYSWQGVLSLLLTLCGEAADLSFDLRALGQGTLPTLEIRLDRPEELEEPGTEVRDGARLETWSRGTVVLAAEIPGWVLPEGPVWIMRESGAAAVTYRAFRETVRLLSGLKAAGLPARFSWSSIPLAPICDDPAVLARRERAAWLWGAVHTVWLRCEEEERLKAALRTVEQCGQLRAQNMTTANTWIAGRVDETALLAGLRGEFSIF